MGEWGSEEQLIRFGQQHEGFLGDAGLQTPTKDGNWVDVIAQARKR